MSLTSRAICVCVIAVAFLVTYYVSDQQSEIVLADIIPDHRLIGALREELQIPLSGRIAKSRLTRVSELKLWGRGIASVEGLDRLVPNLRVILAHDNTISDIRPLASLIQLQDVSLAGNNISDLTPLQSLPDLRFLDVADNHIKSISPLASLDRLEMVVLTNNPITDVRPLVACKSLTSLDLQGCQIDDISPLRQLERLETCNLKDTLVVDKSPLRGLKNLHTVLYDEPFSQ